MQRLLLWDIDGTLLTTGSVNRAALQDAFLEVLGEPVDDRSCHFSGRTDLSIIRELLTSHGVDQAGIDALVRKVSRRFGPALSARKAELQVASRVLPGVFEVLGSLHDYEASVLSTVLTGNLAVNAVLKLDAVRLAGYFDLEVGAYGSDKEDRLDLVDVVLDRLAARGERSFADDEIWVIGDTPADYATARENDVRCLLVATGTYGYDELSALEPDAILEDLSNSRSFAEAVGLV